MLPREHYLKQTYMDAVNFPEGFEKGGLSDIQARLVKKHGVLINALSLDEVSNPTVDDLHLLKVISNQSSPKSPNRSCTSTFKPTVCTSPASER